MDVQLCMHWLKHPLLDTLIHWTFRPGVENYALHQLQDTSSRPPPLPLHARGKFTEASPSSHYTGEANFSAFQLGERWWVGAANTESSFYPFAISSTCYFSFPSLVPSIPTQLASTLAAPSSIIKDMAALSSSIIKGRPFPSSHHLISTATALLVLCFKN